MMKIKKILLVLFLIVFSGFVFANDRITHLPGLTHLSDKEYAGYTPAGKHDQLFYWFVVSHKPNAPIIVWSNGGPGYSSMYGFFDETGPYAVTSSLQLKKRAQAWTQFANYLVIDQPAGVGMSLLKSNQLPLSRSNGIIQYYAALSSFLKNHPAYEHSPIILAGESYAGTYLPLLAKKILDGNKQAGFKINLKAIILMSPWIDPIVQQSMDSTYAFNHGLITHKQKIRIDGIYQHCALLIKTHHYRKANTVCNEIDGRIRSYSHLQMANIAYKENFSNVSLDHYLRQKSVLAAIHAQYSHHFACWSNAANKPYLNSIQRSVGNVYNELLSHHVRVFIFSGLNYDKDTNY